MQPESKPTRERLFHLRPIFRPRQRVLGGMFVGVPWVDVILLVVFFMMTQTATLKKPGLKMDLPVVPTATGARYDAFVLTIARDGVFYLADERVHRSVLADRLAALAREHADAELIIEADGSVPHQALADVYSQAAEAGWTKIILATRLPPPAGSTP
jgi:biopolymer transport protein ExbD